ncbi:MAG: type II/IV secretion system protein [Elusimicrobia bacterium]|nr:type II/IV secretion system protein [Elusimicrobiota bacterium]
MALFGTTPLPQPQAAAPAGPDTLEQRYESLLSAKGKTDANTLTNGFLRAILEFALREGASDIHFDPLGEMFRLRFRIDGSLKDKLIFYNNDFSVTSQLRVMAGFAPQAATAYTPEDGGFEVVVGDRPVRFRVSAFPSIHGDKLVLRILDMGHNTLMLEHLGFAPDVLAQVQSAIKSPSGIFFVCGVTGGGKSTTLCSILKALTRPEISIMTLEDPVEYMLPGVTQSKISPQAGFNFADGLRSILRQDPNIIMVGEIRDRETAEIAIRAALTGHLIFTTIHATSSVGVITRLVNIGIEPFLISSSTVGVVAQRLIRRVCQECAQPADPDSQTISRIVARSGSAVKAVLTSSEKKFVRATGCPACNGSGYRGRIGVFELLLPNNESKALIDAKASTADLRKAAIKSGMRTMMMDGITKARAGLTTLDEVLSAVSE